MPGCDGKLLDSNGKQKRTAILQLIVIQLIGKHKRSSWPEKTGLKDQLRFTITLLSAIYKNKVMHNMQL